MVHLYFAQFLPEQGAHALAAFEAVELEFFVGRMRIVIRQTEAQQQ